MTNFKDKNVHFIGIGGVGVNALAKYVLANGGYVSGSDAKFSKLCKEIADLGALVYEGVNPNFVDSADIVVYSSAIKPENAELARARELNKTTFERQEFLRLIASSFKSVVGIAGTHGKTTTTAMLAHILSYARKKFVGMIGGESVDFGNFVNNSFGANDIFIVEACEYKRNFLTLNPNIAVVTNIECDHPDCYSDFASVKQAFDEYLLSAPVGICLKSDNGDSWEMQKTDSGKSEVFRGELKDGICSLSRGGVELCKIELEGGGDYNYKNATFAIVTAMTLGIDASDSETALKTFKGVCRRFEYSGKIKGVPVYFDFAHHPTEISCVLKRAGEFGKILAVFQPHTYSRTKAYFEDFVNVFGKNENISSLAFMPTYSARENFDANFEVDALAKAIVENCDKRPYVAKNGDEICEFVSENAGAHDIILFIGAGDIYDLKSCLKFDD